MQLNFTIVGRGGGCRSLPTELFCFILITVVLLCKFCGGSLHFCLARMAELLVMQYQWIEIANYQMSMNTRREQSSPSKSPDEQSSYTHNNKKILLPIYIVWLSRERNAVILSI